MKTKEKSEIIKYKIIVLKEELEQALCRGAENKNLILKLSRKLDRFIVLYHKNNCH